MEFLKKIRGTVLKARGKRLMRKLDRANQYALNGGLVSETQIGFLRETPAMKALYQELKEVYRDSQNTENRISIMREKGLSLPQLAALNRMYAEEIREELGDDY